MRRLCSYSFVLCATFAFAVPLIHLSLQYAQSLVPARLHLTTTSLSSSFSFLAYHFYFACIHSKKGCTNRRLSASQIEKTHLPSSNVFTLELTMPPLIKDRRSQLAYRRARTCVRCSGVLMEKAKEVLVVAPCGHIFCDVCFPLLPTNEPTFCFRDPGVCVQRATEGPWFSCPHPVTTCNIWAGEATRPKIHRDFFLRNNEVLGAECGRCMAERLLQKYTAEARRTRLAPGRFVFACLGKALDAIHGQAVAALTLSPLDELVPALDGFGRQKTLRFRQQMRGLANENGWNEQLLCQEIVFRESFIDGVCGREVGPDDRVSWAGW